MNSRMQEWLENAFDAHAHYSFVRQPERFAAWAIERFLGAFSTTVDFEDHIRSRELFASFPAIRVGLGAHPWWVARGEIDAAQVARITDQAKDARFIGEVGLDFGVNGLRDSAFTTDEETKAVQVEALRAILSACVSSDAELESGRVFSFHAVRSADVIMDMLEECSLLPGNTAIFHWFSGSSAQLQRARELGCCFSVNAFMLQTRRGREYAKAIPADRLLVETDLPEEPSRCTLPSTDEEACSFEAACEAYEGTLVATYQTLVELRGSGILACIEGNAHRIFS